MHLLEAEGHGNGGERGGVHEPRQVLVELVQVAILEDGCGDRAEQG